MLADIVPRLKGSGFSGILISITNPCDVIARCLFTYMDMPAARVFGTGTGLDSARLNARLAESLGLPAHGLNCLALGEHGDSQLAPLSQARIGQGKAPDGAAFFAAARAAREGGARIIQGKGSTEFGIGTVLLRIARAILRNEQCLLPVSARLEGQYGQRDVYAGVPAIIGRGGVESIVELALTPEELAGFAASCALLDEFYRKAVTIYETVL
jgi:L-lactate dehydrogenase